MANVKKTSIICKKQQQGTKDSEIRTPQIKTPGTKSSAPEGDVVPAPQ